MQFALINNERVLPTPELKEDKAKAICPCCSQPVHAKCGEQRVWHWAHVTKRTCDTWWETETQWHRTWKNHFPHEWQEVIQHDQSGEKHIADVRNPHGLVIEFQHSFLKPEERASREHFYKNMVWVVDGTRLTRDYPRFQKGMTTTGRVYRDGVYIVNSPDKCFPANWLESTVPVIFDFRGLEPTVPQDNGRELLWCLLPTLVDGKAVVIALFRDDFVKSASDSSELLPVNDIIKMIKQPIRRPQPPNMMIRPRYPRRRRSRF